MTNFNEGDRVTHPTHGDGTVCTPHDGTEWPTVWYDHGKKIMTHSSFLTPIPDTAPFMKGDRVEHRLHGIATVTGWDASRKLVEIEPFGYGGSTVFVHPVSLTLVPPLTGKFKIGDRVSHPLHRDGTVESISQHNGLHTVALPGNRIYYALEHQIEHAVPPATYHICIEEITGAAHVPHDLTAKEVSRYIAEEVDWRVVVEIKITKNA